MNSVDQAPVALRECRDSFLVCGLQFDGRGDVYGAHEIALRVQKLMPEAKIVFTVLQPRFGLTLTLMFQDKDFVDLAKIKEEENWEIAGEETVLAAIDTFRKIIIYPTYHDSLLPEEILNRNDDVIKLRENSVVGADPELVKGPTYTLGLKAAMGEKGVLIPMEMLGKLPAPRENNTLKRLQHLKDVNPILSALILGGKFSTKAAKTFHKDSKLFLGYCSQPNVLFCYINALMISKLGNLTICNTQKRPEGLFDHIFGNLEKNGFGKIRIIEFTSPEEYKEEFQEAPQKRKRTLTLIFRALKGPEMEAMLNSTEDECLVTGDLSPFRFLAHRKLIAYDTRAQKHEQALAMIELASKFHPAFKELLPQAFFGDPLPSDEVNVVRLENGMAAFFSALDKDPKLKRDWDRFIDEIFTNHDFTPHLQKILGERLLEGDK